MFTADDLDEQKIDTTATIDQHVINIASSNDNQRDVDVIWNNSNRFAQLVVKYGFWISFQTDNEDNVVLVQLIQITDNCDYRRALCSMESLLKSLKKERKKSGFFLFRPFSTILASRRERQKARREEFEKRKEVERIAKWRESFLNQTGMSVIKNSNDILDDICQRLSVEIEGHAPLQAIRSIEGRRKTIIEFIEYLQHPINGGSLHSVKLELFRWFIACSSSGDKNFILPPEITQKFQLLAQQFKEKFQLDNVVGTVHYLEVIYDNVLCVQALVIVDMKLMVASIATTKESALEKVYDGIKTMFPDFKFAIDCLYKSEYSDVFTPCYNLHAYIENERAVNWMRNNFKCIAFPLLSRFPIFDMYNFFFSSYRCHV